MRLLAANVQDTNPPPSRRHLDCPVFLLELPCVAPCGGRERVVGKWPVETTCRLACRRRLRCPIRSTRSHLPLASVRPFPSADSPLFSFFFFSFFFSFFFFPPKQYPLVGDTATTCFLRVLLSSKTHRLGSTARGYVELGLSSVSILYLPVMLRTGGN